jgi:sugar phosphate permease
MSTESVEQLTTASKPAGKLRYWISLSTFLIYFVAFVDRSNVSILITDKNFTDALGITGDKPSQGLLMTSFLLLYGLSCFFIGPIVNRFGIRRMLMWGVISWAVIMAIMGSMSSILVLLGCRALLGVAESSLGPCVSRYVQNWYPVQERVKANGFWFAGLEMATIVTMPLMVILISYFGWRGSFFSLAILGLAPVILIYLFMYSKPSEHPKMTAEELTYINAGRIEETVTSRFGGFSFLKDANYWRLTVLYVIANACHWGAVWIPRYLKDTMGLSFAKTGFVATIPVLAAVLALIIFTPVMDRSKVKAKFAVVGAIGFGLLLFAAMQAKTTWEAVFFLSLYSCITVLITPYCFTTVQNHMKPSEVANAIGVLNGVGYAGSAIFPYLMGVLFAMTKDLTSGFYLLCSLSVVAIIVGIPLIKNKY